MPKEIERGGNKFERVFEQLDEVKVDIAKIKVWEDVEKELIKDIQEKLEKISATLNQIIGKEAVRSGIYGVVGAVISGIVVWLVGMFGKGH